MIVREQITGLILAGGRGSRMGGVDKGLQSLEGKALIAHVIGRLQAQVGPLMISANRHIDAYRSWGNPVVKDKWDDYRGPLAGLVSAISQVETPFILLSPCDTPYLPSQLGARLGAALDADCAEAAVAVCGGKIQSLCVLLRRELEASLHDCLARGGGSVQGWLRQCRLVEVDFEDQTSAFININTQSDLDALGRGAMPPDNDHRGPDQARVFACDNTEANQRS